jgi:hypothetical protein
MQIDHLQAESPEENHYANMEEMGDAKGEAEEYAYHSGPAVVEVSATVALKKYR